MSGADAKALRRNLRSLTSRVHFRLFWDCYDHLGGWVVINLSALALSTTGLLAPFAFGGLLACAARAENEKDVTFAQFWSGARRLAGRIYALALLHLTLSVLCAVNITFYFQFALRAESMRIVWLALCFLFLWLAVFIQIWLATAAGFMALQDIGVGKSLRRAALVVVAHPFACLMLVMTLAGLSILFVISGIGALGLGLALLAVAAIALPASAVELYDEIEELQERERLKREGAKTWAEQRALDERTAARERRYQRTFREIIRPWEMK